MITNTSKTGRPQAVYRMANGDQIVGLQHLKDGRWRASGPAKYTFRAADEFAAVAHFNQWKARNATNISKVIVHPTLAEAVQDSNQRRADADGPLKTYIRIPSNVPGAYAVSDDALTEAQWAWLRLKILSEPKWVAQRVGIEQIGWLDDLKPPVPSPTLESIGTLYSDKPNLSSNEGSRSKLFWAEFIKATGCTTVKGIDHEAIIRYETAILKADYAPKSVLHRYRKIRTVLAHAIKRGIGVADCRHALDVSMMLEVKDAHPLDPRPIDTADFWMIHNEAVKVGDHTFAAMMLVAANCAMYAGEVACLKWEEVDLKRGELVTRRPKTGVSRVAILWPEVVKAIKGLPHTGDHIFNGFRSVYNVNAVLKRWRQYRITTDLPENVVFSQIRDASFTVACRTSLDQARLLAGHRISGSGDNYLRRTPSIVGDVCKAIRSHFYADRKATNSTSKAVN